MVDALESFHPLLVLGAPLSHLAFYVMHLRLNVSDSREEGQKLSFQDCVALVHNLGVFDHTQGLLMAFLDFLGLAQCFFVVASVAVPLVLFRLLPYRCEV